MGAKIDLGLPPPVTPAEEPVPVKEVVNTHYLDLNLS